jgi:hypothetical protein
MITESAVTEWYDATSAAHTKLDELAPEAAEYYRAAGDARLEKIRINLAALQALESKLTVDGFGSVYQDGGKFHCNYGPIKCRLFIEHEGMDKFTFTIVALKGGSNYDVHEVAEYELVVGEVLNIERLHHDIAGLVLP